VSTMRQRADVGLTLAFVKASPDAQLRLLELADLDTELARLSHRRRSLPEIAELEQLTARTAKIKDEITRAGTELADLGREQTRAERDVEQVRVRIDKDQQRLDGGKVSSAKELESLQSEITSLRRRQGDLEEVVLELMERTETAQSRHDAAAAVAEKVAVETAAVAERRDAALTEIGVQEATAAASRGEVASGVPAELLALYDKVRTQVGGSAAAMLRRGECQGCRVELSTVELNEVRSAAPDEVVRHEECRRILIRTAESGL
ncbi:MAG: zinc ribbon domain-containing protein, partial [Streptosporangiaceae bacterium]